MADSILTVNAGSSSIKFALFEHAGDAHRVMGQIDGIGVRTHMKIKGQAGETLFDEDLDGADDHHASLAAILRWFEANIPDMIIAAVGHRVVHGGVKYAEPVKVTAEIADDLEGLRSLAPLHQPHNIAGIRAAMANFPNALQVACFDTAFHRQHPFVNDTFALPHHFYEEGVRRYGFHGLSYEFISEELKRVAPMHAAGRVVVAHLGNGASMAAIQDGKSIGSTMGFSALDGLPMGTRCGQIDPGVLLYLMQEKGMNADEISDLLYKQSGLKGMSGVSNDMRALEASSDPRADQAIDYFVFRIRRELGGLTAVLGGIDALIFTGGIGENSARIRERVASGSEWMGLALDSARNKAGDTIISNEVSRARIMVLRTNEEAMIARHTRAHLG